MARTLDEYSVFSGYMTDTFSKGRKEQDRKQPAKLIFLKMTSSGDDDLLPDEIGHPVPWEKTAESLRKNAPALQQATIDSFRKGELPAGNAPSLPSFPD